jgi:mannan endo-1,4-beta-mannosidase
MIRSLKFIIFVSLLMLSLSAIAMPVRILPGTLHDTGAIVFWEEPQGKSSMKYIVKLNGKKYSETNHNSIKLSGLKPRTTYTVGIDGGGNFYKGEISFTTLSCSVRINICDFGARGDSSTINTKFIQRAIDECPAGGTVVVPPGVYITGALFIMRDSINLELMEGATLKAINNLAHFPLMDSRYEGWPVKAFSSVLNLGCLENDGRRFHNIRIYGGGTIDNQGSILSIQQTENLSRMSRSRGIPIINCDNVAIENINIDNPCTWNVHPMLCNGFTTYGCTIKSSYTGLSNADGWDPDSSCDCYLLESILDGQDDNVAIKSVEFINRNGQLINSPSENIYISYCTFERGGGICIGVELPSGVRNVWITHNLVKHSDRGFQICSRQQGQGIGPIENIHFRDIEVYDTGDWGININSWYWIKSYAPGDFTADDVRPIRSITFDDIHIHHTLGNAIQVIGLPEQPINDVYFRNITIDSAQYEVLLRNCSDITLDNVNVGERPWILENVRNIHCNKSTSNPVNAKFRVNPVDLDATYATRALFDNLRRLMEHNCFAFGAQDATASGFGWSEYYGISDIERISGRKPQFYSWDFMHIASPDSEKFETDNRKVRNLTCEAFYSGGINSYCWHAANPITEGSFYETGDSVIPKILPGGEYNGKFTAMLDQIVKFNNTLIGKEGMIIPIIFRPWHEFDGDWFWWSRKFCTPEQFKALWRYTVEYLRDIKGIHNFLYAFSPDINFTSLEEYLEYYPGDQYVDVIGLDDYWDFRIDEKDISLPRHRIEIISDYALSHGKIAALCETGQAGIDNDEWFTRHLLPALTHADGQPIPLAYVATWRNSAPNGFFTPYKGHPATRNFLDFINSPRVVTLSPHDWLGRYYHFKGVI